MSDLSYDQAEWSRARFTEMQNNARAITDAVRGRTVRIKADSHFNDQPYGTSKPKQAGQTGRIVSVICDPHDDYISVLLDGRSLYIGLDECEFIKTKG